MMTLGQRQCQQQRAKNSINFCCTKRKKRGEEERKEIFTGHYNFIRKLQYLLAAGRAQQNNNYNNSLKAIQANYRLVKVWAQ